MKILMVAPEPFFEPRGTPISVYQRLCALSNLGYEVDLLTYHVGEEVKIPGVTIRRIHRIPFIKQVKIGPSWAKLVLDVVLAVKAIALLLTNRYDVIHSHEEAAFFCAWLAQWFRTQHLYDMHSILSRQLANFHFANYWPITAIFRWLERRTIATCDALITIGADLETYAHSINPGLRHIRIPNMPIQSMNGSDHVISASELRQNLGLAGKCLVVYTGTFERYQGLDLLLDSASIVKQVHPQIAYVLVGGTPNRVGYWQSQARLRELHDCTVFVGTVPPGEAWAYLEMAEILISPRIAGTTVPLKIYSYLQAGKPILATDLSAHTQVLNNEIALLVPPTKECLADGVLRLAQDPRLREHLGRQAKGYADSNLIPGQYLSRMRQIYRALEAGVPA